MKVLVTSKSFGKVFPDAVRMLNDAGIEVVRASKPSMSATEIASQIKGFDALVVGNDTVDASVFAAADQLKIVHMHGTGLDAIDIDAATRNKVLVANAPGANSNAVAELTVALMLVCARSIDKHIDILKDGRWERSAGNELSGKTLALIGLGNIGRRIAELLRGFEMDIHAFDIHPDSAWAAENNVKLVSSVDTLFPVADFLVLALSLNAQTRNIVDARRLSMMKPTARLINTARGGLIDEQALCSALTEKKIAGAAIDAFDPEPLPLDSPLRGLGMTLTPHLAASSQEAAENVSKIVARNLIDVLIHKQNQCAVNLAGISG